MKKQFVIKSERVLNQITHLIYKKVYNKTFSIWQDDYKVEVLNLVKGNLSQIIVYSDYRLISKCVIDTVWEVISEYENKYGDCVYGLIGSRPYLCKDNTTWLTMPVIEITVRAKEN